MAIQIGDKAPEVLGLDQNGKEIKLSDFKGKKLALYFYPKDNTSGCTAEACSLRDGYKELQAAGYEVVGVSKDSAKSHQGFIAKQELPFSLIADTDTTLQQQFGVWAEKKLYGRSYMGTLRTTFIIDEDGIVTNIIGPKEVKTKSIKGNGKRRFIRRRQTAGSRETGCKRRQIESASRSNGQDRKKLRKRFDHEIG